MWLMMGQAKWWHKNSYDLLILDWMLPTKQVWNLPAVANWGQITPVLFLKDTLDDRVQGLMLVLMTIW